MARWEGGKDRGALDLASYDSIVLLTAWTQRSPVWDVSTAKNPSDAQREEQELAHLALGQGRFSAGQVAWWYSRWQGGEVVRW